MIIFGPDKFYIMEVMQDVCYFLFRLQDDLIELDWILWDI